MRVLFLADINSIHTQRWVIALNKRGLEVAVFSINPLYHIQQDLSGIPVFSPGKFKKDISGSGLLSKIKYLTLLSSVRKSISRFRPDIVHAHYASSYGLLGSLCGFHPYILSVWGSDVYAFPKRSILTRAILKYNFKIADQILSTSQAMAAEAGLYTSKMIRITPFGIDPEIFRPQHVDRQFSPGEFVIGTTKSLEPEYGIDTLIKSFAKLVERHPDQPMKLLIIGGGSLEKELKNLAITLGLEKKVIFAGKISHYEIPLYLNMLDVYAALSRSESFGVSVIEASACSLPVVVTRIGGLKEVAEHQVTGLLVAPENIDEAVISFEMLLSNPDLRKKLGQNGRALVSGSFNWNNNVQSMIEIYEQFFHSKP